MKPKDGGSEHPEGAVAVAALVVPGRQAAELLAAIDQALHPVPQPVRGAVERSAAPLGPLAGDCVADAAPSTVRSIPPPGVAFVADHPVGPQAGTAPARPSDGALLQQPLEDGGLVLLARRQQQRQQLAPALRPEMDLGREAALAAPERLRRRVPPFAPAAC